LPCAEDAIVADHSAFDCRAIAQFNDARDYAPVGEIHVIYPPAALGENLSVVELDKAQMRSHLFKVNGAC
jgi:hypothetical protein